jgi:hypothetical protein
LFTFVSHALEGLHNSFQFIINVSLKFTAKP